MQKSVYSLVLSDEVVRGIDRVAYGMNTSRSSLINQILADYVSYTTPEKRMQQIFSTVEQQLCGTDDIFHVLMQSSDNLFSLRSALSYKYNPTVRYSVELNRAPGRELGELRVSLRSTSNALLLYLLQFFRLWHGLEQEAGLQPDAVIEDGKYRRKLVLQGPDDQGADPGEAIAAYINALNTAMQAFFESPADESRAYAAIRRVYAEYLNRQKLLV